MESRENIEDDKVEVPSDIAPPPPAFDNHTRPMKEEVTKLYCLLNIVEKEEYIILQWSQGRASQEVLRVTAHVL